MSDIMSAEQQQRLARCIAQVEQNTAGEIVVAVLHRSSHYSGYRSAFAGIFGLLGGGIAASLLPWLTPPEAVATVALFVALLAWASRYPGVLRHLVPANAKRRAVNERAKILFIEHGVTETRDRSGVLVLLSMLERRVEILGDRGIHEHVGPSAWAAIVNVLTARIAEGSIVDGLEAVILEIGRKLAERFPPRPDDKDELSNSVLTD